LRVEGLELRLWDEQRVYVLRAERALNLVLRFKLVRVPLQGHRGMEEEF
jgi:hypothetical protein